MSALSIIEEGMAFAQRRAAVLASDAANVATPGFTAGDIAPEPRLSDAGIRFAAAFHGFASSPGVGTLEHTMASTAKNSVWYRALTVQARAVLREFKTVAEELRR